MGVQLGSAYGKIEIDASGVRGGIGDARKELAGFQASLKTVGTALTVTGAVLTGLAVKTTLTAARTEELGIVLRNVAKNAGVSMDSIRRQETAIKDLGITTQVADTLLIKMMQNNLDLSRATDLARLAQDAAVISMEDSSEALDGILHGILTLQPEVVRYRGIMVNLEQEYAKWTAANDRTVASLTNTEKQTIFMNAALEAGKAIAGTYEAAMESAGKQMRSMKRHVEEAANEFGQHLLPVLGAVVEAGTDLLKWLRDLPEPVKATVAQVGALGGGVATLAGAAVVAIPKIVALGTALKGLGLGILGPAGVVAGVVTLAIGLANSEKAHRKEAAAILESSETYDDYIQQLEEAGLEGYAFSEALWEVVKAKKAADEAFDTVGLQKARQEIETTTIGLRSYIESLNIAGEDAETAALKLQLFHEQVVEATRRMSRMELLVASNADEMRRLAMDMGMTVDEAAAFARELGIAATVQQATRDSAEGLGRSMVGVGEAMYDAAAKAAALKAEQEKAARSAEAMKRAEENLAEAVQAARDRFEGFYGTLANGIVAFRELGAEQKASAEEYEESLESLEAKARNVYREVKLEFEASLPEPTSVQQRLGMTEDAWDEWGLRIQTIINDGVASPWYAALQEMGYAKPPDVGMKEWAEELKRQFYEGDLPGLINQNAQAWVENAETQKRAQADATAAYQAEVGKRKAAVQEEIDALNAAREAQLKAEQEARNRATIELALSLAEQTGMLQAWSQQRFGPDFSQVADSADEVLALLDSGMLSIDGTLQTLISNSVAGVQTALDTTGGLAEETKLLLDGIATTDWAAEKQKVLESAFDPETMPVAAMIAKSKQMGDGMEAGIPKDPFAKVLASFEGAASAIIASAGTMDAEVKAAFGSIEAQSGTVAAAIINAWTGHSVFPDLIAAGLDMQRQVKSDFQQMELAGLGSARRLKEGWLEGMKLVREAIKKVLELLDDIPKTITIKVTTEVDGGGTPPGLQYGGPVIPGKPYVVGEAGPEVFVPHQAGTVLPNQVAQALMALAHGLATRTTDNRGYGQSVNIFGGMTLSGVQDAETLLAQLMSVQ